MTAKDLAQAFHPGEYIAEEMKARGWTRESLCEVSGMRGYLVDELLACKRPVTTIVAHCLAMAFGTGEQVWLNLQKAFDEFRARMPDHGLCALCHKPMSNVSTGFGVFNIKGQEMTVCMPCGKSSGGKEVARAR